MKHRLIEIDTLKAHPDYAPILAHWSYDEWYKNRAMEFDLILKSYKARTLNDHIPISLVAINVNFPVGMVSLKENDLWSRKDLSPWLTALYVMPEYRGMGIGSILIDGAVQKAARLGYERIFLFLGKNNTFDLENFYKHKGWLFFSKACDNDGEDTSIYYTLTQGNPK